MRDGKKQEDKRSKSAIKGNTDIMSRKCTLRRHSSLDESPQNSLLNKIFEYHEKRWPSGENARVHSLRCAFAACHSASDERRASLDTDIPGTAEEILESLGLSKNQPPIPERFLKGFEQRFKNLDSRIASSIEDVRCSRSRPSFDGKTPPLVYVENARNSSKVSLAFGERHCLTRSKTLMSLHMEDSVDHTDVSAKSSLSETTDHEFQETKEDLAVGEKEAEHEKSSINEADLAAKQNEYASINSDMEYYDSDSSVYATPCCDLPHRSSPDHEPEHRNKLRRRSLSCSDVQNLEHQITSGYATLCKEFRKFRGLNASDSNIQISLNSPAKRPYDRYNSLFTSDSEDDDILCVTMPATEEDPKKLTSVLTPLDLKQISYVRLVEDCRECDLCRAASADIHSPYGQEGIIKQTPGDAKRFPNPGDKMLNFVTKNNGCNQSDVKRCVNPEREDRINRSERSRAEQFAGEIPECDHNPLSKEENAAGCNYSMDNAKEETTHQKKSIQENAATGKSSINTRSKRASTELAELQSVIQNTKIKRESAARQLFLLQELLHGTDTIPELSDVSEYFVANNNSAATKNASCDNEALSELQLRAGHEEMQRANSVGALEKPDEEEEKVTKREQELKMQLEKLQEEMEKMRMENEKLKTEISEQKQDTSELEKRHQDDLSLPSDPSFDSNSPPNSPDKHVDESHSLRKRLKDAEDRAYQAENRSDELNLLLNHKLIEINKLQLTLSNQTKDLIQLEKAYYQLRCHLHRNRKMTSPTVRRITSKLNKTT